jgi:hypothetical protein
MMPILPSRSEEAFMNRFAGVEDGVTRGIAWKHLTQDGCPYIFKRGQRRFVEIHETDGFSTSS